MEKEKKCYFCVVKLDKVTIFGFTTSDKFTLTGGLTSCCTGLFFLQEHAIILCLFYLFINLFLINICNMWFFS